MTSTSSARRPPDQPTNEATKEGLRLAQDAGQAYQHMVEYFIDHVATTGARQRAGEYQIGLAVEHAEPLYHLLDGRLQLKDPVADANAHLEVVVMDGADGRFLPELTVHVTLIDAQGQELGTYALPFLWHPTMYHYGCNVHVPGPGAYTARVYVAVPAFPRHDPVNGKRYGAPVMAEFSGMQITPGRK